MKVFYVTGSSGPCPQVQLGADSAVLRPSEPVFVPEPVDDWLSLVAPAVRISRLGTHISRHPESYYDAVAAVHVLMPARPDVVPGIPPLALDRAISPGAWQPVEPGTIEMTVRRSLLWGDDPDVEAILAADFSLTALALDGLIRHISRYLTFKSGDIIVLADAAASLGAPILDTRIQVWINGDPSLDVKIK